MEIPGALMDEISQFVNVDRDTLIARGVASLLKEKKRQVLLERLQLLTRHGVRSRQELEGAIQEGADLIFQDLPPSLSRCDAPARAPASMSCCTAAWYLPLLKHYSKAPTFSPTSWA
jgi:hypothetical protein